jgi:DNA-binding Xre family transcriptional regulator
MGIEWKLKAYLAESHAIYNVVGLKKRIEQKTGITISTMNLCKLVNKKPKMLRLETLEILCSALSCNCDDFFKVKPKKFNPNNKRKLSFKNTPLKLRAKKAFPDPEDYE